MKIVHIITRLIIGGAQENTLLSCQGQHDDGHEVTLITGPAIGPEGSLLQRAKNYGYRVLVVESMRRAIHPRDLLVYQQLRDLIRRLGPDIVHTHSSKAGILGRWAAHYSAPPAPCKSRHQVADPHRPAIVHTIHGLAFTASTSPAVNAVYRWMEQRTAPITDSIVCVADAMADQSLLQGIGKPGQYTTIYSGMETGSFLHPPVPREQVRRDLGLHDNHIVVGTIARLFDLKGHDDLLELAPALCGQFPQLRFLWIGDGSLREQFERQMQSMGLRDRFILTGMVAPSLVPQFAAAMDVLVHPSRREGLARALPQGALVGCPVVTYDIDGNREGLVDGETGFLLPPFDRQKLSAALVVLLGDPQRRREMGRRGREFALGRFDAPVMVRQLDRLYRGLIEPAESRCNGSAEALPHR